MNDHKLSIWKHSSFRISWKWRINDLYLLSFSNYNKLSLTFIDLQYLIMEEYKPLLRNIKTQYWYFPERLLSDFKENVFKCFVWILIDWNGHFGSFVIYKYDISQVKSFQPKWNTGKLPWLSYACPVMVALAVSVAAACQAKNVHEGWNRISFWNIW